MTEAENKAWWARMCKEWVDDIETTNSLHKTYKIIPFYYTNELRDSGYVYTCVACGTKVTDMEFGGDYSKPIEEKFIPCPIDSSPKSGHGNYADILHIVLN